MLKTHEKSFSILQKLVDLALALACWWIVVYIRIEYLKGQPIDRFETFKLSIPIAFLTSYFFSRYGLYKSHRLSELKNEIVAVFKANFFAVAVLLLLIYFMSDNKFSRGILIGYYFFSSIAFTLLRFFLRVGLRAIRRQGRNIRHVLLVGHGEMIESYVNKLRHLPDTGINFRAWLDSNGASDKFGILDFKEDFEKARKLFKPDHVIISYPGYENDKVESFLKRNYNDTLPLVVLPDLRYTFIGYHVEDLAGFPALVVNQPNYSAVDEVGKRVFDFVLSAIGLLLLSPLFVILGILIKLDSRGPIFFTQERIGLDGKRFRMFKFRSMKMDAEQSSQWTVKEDNRRTRLGRVLRASSLDELPQLFNVFLGDMSLVGPRPEQPQFVERFRQEIPAYMLRHKVKAGITGWAQVNGWRGDTSLEKRIECDLYYVRNWSLWFDVQILFMTVWKVYSKNAY